MWVAVVDAVAADAAAMTVEQNVMTADAAAEAVVATKNIFLIIWKYYLYKPEVLTSGLLLYLHEYNR